MGWWKLSLAQQVSPQGHPLEAAKFLGLGSFVPVNNHSCFCAHLTGSGILYALTAGQPLTLLGPTGLMVVFSGLLYKVMSLLALAQFSHVMDTST